MQGSQKWCTAKLPTIIKLWSILCWLVVSCFSTKSSLHTISTEQTTNRWANENFCINWLLPLKTLRHFNMIERHLNVMRLCTMAVMKNVINCSYLDVGSRLPLFIHFVEWFSLRLRFSLRIIFIAFGAFWALWRLWALCGTDDDNDSLTLALIPFHSVSFFVCWLFMSNTHNIWVASDFRIYILLTDFFVVFLLLCIHISVSFIVHFYLHLFSCCRAILRHLFFYATGAFLIHHTTIRGNAAVTVITTTIPTKNHIKGMRILVMLLLDTLPMLGNVLLLCFFVFFIFGIIGVQLWEGILRQRCVLQLPDHVAAPK